MATEYETIINTIEDGTQFKFYSTPYNYLDEKTKIAKIFAVISGMLIPVKLDWQKLNLQSTLPIRKYRPSC